MPFDISDISAQYISKRFYPEEINLSFGTGDMLG